MGFFDVMHEAPVKFGVDRFPPFTRISIETCGGCNRTCWFCPSHQRKGRGFMSDELYSKILIELGEDFNGVVQWFYVNEPLADPKHIQRIKDLRAACPRCTIHLTTNWDLMWRKDWDEQYQKANDLFIAGVNSLNLNDYDDRGYSSFVKQVADWLKIPIVDHCWKRIGPRKCVISCGPLPTELHSWQGHNEGTAGGKKHCARPHRHIVVCWDGKVPLCCAADPTNTEWLGDINQSTLDEVWQSKRIFEYRYDLQRGCRKGVCEKCDERMAFPHVVRKVEL